jgi:glycosyltransferase involved in cell wall biosynthesis
VRLLIVSHVIHYQHGGKLYAYGPYAREIDLWADLFAEVQIASPCRYSAPPDDSLPFDRPNISIVPQIEAGGTTLLSKLKLAALTPALIWNLARAMARADAIHVRCPGNIGLLGALLAPCYSRFLVAKYAAQWSSLQGEPLSARFQKALLRSRFWRGPVTVYGKWPGQSANITPFFTSLLSDEQISRARGAVTQVRPAGALRVLYTGRLSKAKNVDSVLQAVARTIAAGKRATCTIVGEGPERAALERLSASLGISSAVTFAGGVGFDRILHYLETSDVLALTSETEGWPKSIAEGMAFGLVCIGSNRGFVPEMLGSGRGLVVPPRDVDTLAALLLDIADNPAKYEEMRLQASAWARQYSLEGLRTAIRNLLEERWSVTLDSVPQAANTI